VKDTIYYKQAELLLRVLPYINKENVFVLKGGTAINFFVRDLPRISVDIDLAYVPINNREAALTDISKTLENISSNIRQAFPGCSINLKRIQKSKIIRAMIISVNDITVKIEANLVLRGTIYNPEAMDLC
jgi:predicted nucleotidyltransferase component of viral defense system